MPPLARDDSLGRELPSTVDEDGVSYIVVHPLSPTAADEMTLAVGDKIIVGDVFSDGWGFGVKLQTGDRGFLPLHHITEDRTPFQSNGSSRQPSPARSNKSSVISSPVSERTAWSASGSSASASASASATTPPKIIMPPSFDVAPIKVGPGVETFNASIQALSVTTPIVAAPPYSPAAASTGSAPTGSSSSSSFLKKKGIPPPAAPMPNLPNVPPVQALNVDGVVNVRNAEAHLGLLHRFVVLEPHDRFDQMADWRYLCRAELRYLKWLNFLATQRPHPDSLPLPPIDVALMWHAHMLNPLRYYEDTSFILGASAPEYSMPLQRMHQLEGLEYDPQDGSQSVWTSVTDEPYTIPLGDQTPVSVTCPWCMKETLVDADVYVSFRMKDTGISCQDCGVILTADNVSAKRFLTDCTLYLTQARPVRGSILDEKTQTVNTTKAMRDLDILLKSTASAAAINNMLLRANDASTCNWTSIENDMKEVIGTLRKGRLLKGVRRSTLTKVLKAYKYNMAPTSIDLVAAVLRQRPFTLKMVSGVVDWLERDALPRATQRYHKFITLMAREPSKFLVPTLDIDLMWHTHQLFPNKYRSYTLSNVRQVVNHDDGVDDKTLDDSFVTTTKLWKRHFREQYSYLNKESKWFRRAPRSVFPAYATYAASQLPADATHVNR
ncbi:hypothetical protein DFJ73DRAFT_242910, partial [Zopfochytrium polystomum]